jgi:hypothetical protein
MNARSFFFSFDSVLPGRASEARIWQAPYPGAAKSSKKLLQPPSSVCRMIVRGLE